MLSRRSGHLAALPELLQQNLSQDQHFLWKNNDIFLLSFSKVKSNKNKTRQITFQKTTMSKKICAKLPHFKTFCNFSQVVYVKHLWLKRSQEHALSILGQSKIVTLQTKFTDSQPILNQIRNSYCDNLFLIPDDIPYLTVFPNPSLFSHTVKPLFFPDQFFCWSTWYPVRTKRWHLLLRKRIFILEIIWT